MVESCEITTSSIGISFNEDLIFQNPPLCKLKCLSRFSFSNKYAGLYLKLFTDFAFYFWVHKFCLKPCFEIFKTLFKSLASYT